MDKQRDLETLEFIARRQAALEEDLAALLAERQEVWSRRVAAGDTSKAELARASGCTPHNVNYWLARAGL